MEIENITVVDEEGNNDEHSFYIPLESIYSICCSSRYDIKQLVKSLIDSKWVYLQHEARKKHKDISCCFEDNINYNYLNFEEHLDFLLKMAKCPKEEINKKI